MKKQKIKEISIVLGGILLGLVVARTAYAQTTIQTLIADLVPLIDMLILVLTGVALLVFIWGMIKFIAKAGDENERKEGKQRMIWGVIAFFVLVTLWGLVRFIQQSLGIFGSSTPPTLPLP